MKELESAKAFGARLAFELEERDAAVRANERRVVADLARRKAAQLTVLRSLEATYKSRALLEFADSLEAMPNDGG
jgi:hypothetical protein